MNLPQRSEIPDAAYDKIASEYYDASLHPTCQNFNHLSRLYITKHFPASLLGSKVLEIGAGASTVAPILHSRRESLEQLYITDISVAMLEHSRHWEGRGANLTISAATALPFSATTVSFAIAGLGDAYNSPSFWSEMSRILEPGGRVVFTTPSYEWASRFRKMTHSSLDVAHFVLRDGTPLAVPSVVLTLMNQVQLIEQHDLTLVDYEALGPELLDGQHISPKIKLVQNEILSIVSGFVAQKPKLKPTT